MTGPLTDAGKALVEWASRAYPNQIDVWREHAVLIEEERARKLRMTQPTPRTPMGRTVLPCLRRAYEREAITVDPATDEALVDILAIEREAATGRTYLQTALSDMEQVARLLDAIEDHAMSNGGRPVSAGWLVASIRETRTALSTARSKVDVERLGEALDVLVEDGLNFDFTDRYDAAARILARLSNQPSTEPAQGGTDR